jgi:RNA polymerase sigma-70 factor (ECF subfamily)
MFDGVAEREPPIGDTPSNVMGEQTMSTNVATSRPSAWEQRLALSDDEAVARIRAGEPALYEVIMRRHNQRLYRTVRAILREEHEVEDVLQEAYLTAYRKLAEFEGRARFSTWLVRIAVNKALDRRRRRFELLAPNPEREAVMTNDAIEATSAREDPEQRSARREFARLLESAIDGLPDVFRGVYVLRDVEGMSTQETAEVLALAPNTVKTRLHRARAILRESLSTDLDATALAAFPFGAARCDRLVAAVLERIAADAR